MTPPKTAPAGAEPTEPLDPPALAEVEAALARADVARFMRRRQIAQALPEGGIPAAVGKAHSVGGQIAETLVPDRAIRPTRGCSAG